MSFGSKKEAELIRGHIAFIYWAKLHRYSRADIIAISRKNLHSDKWDYFDAVYKAVLEDPAFLPAMLSHRTIKRAADEALHASGNGRLLRRMGVSHQKVVGATPESIYDSPIVIALAKNIQAEFARQKKAHPSKVKKAFQWFGAKTMQGMRAMGKPFRRQKRK